MPQPTPSSLLNNPSHSTLHNIHHNVKAYGAVGNGVADDTTAIQAAITAMTSGGTITGTLFFPAGNYKISNPIVIGDGTKYVSLSIIGQSYHSAAAGILRTVVLSPTDPNDDGIQFNQYAAHTCSLVIEGIQVYYGSVGTGTAFNMNANNQETTGPVLNNCAAQLAGVGFKIGFSVNARMSNCSALSCATGVLMSGESVNLPQFENCTFQNCSTAGVSMEGFVMNPRFTSCVFQANSGPGLLVPAGSNAVFRSYFDSCWWEFPGNDMIRIAGAGAGFSFNNATFIGCTFDGSFNDRNVINVQGAAGSGIHGRGLTFIECFQSNTGTGRLLYTATDPSDSTDPGFKNITIIGGTLYNIKGLHTVVSGVGANFFVHDNETNLNVETSTVYSIKPTHTVLSSAGLRLFQVPLIQDGYGPVYHELKEDSTSDAAAGAANTGRLYVRDNGAGKTQLCVRFNTGAVQVIATQP